MYATIGTENILLIFNINSHGVLKAWYLDIFKKYHMLLVFLFTLIEFIGDVIRAFLVWVQLTIFSSLVL